MLLACLPPGVLQVCATVAEVSSRDTANSVTHRKAMNGVAAVEREKGKMKNGRGNK